MQKPFHSNIDVDILNGFFGIPITAKNDIFRLSIPKANGDYPRPTSKKYFFLSSFYFEVTVGQE